MQGWVERGRGEELIEIIKTLRNVNLVYSELVLTRIHGNCSLFHLIIVIGNSVLRKVIVAREKD